MKKTPKQKEQETRAALGPRIGQAPKGAAAKRYGEFYGTRHQRPAKRNDNPSVD